jgi:hypothetical protein
MTIEDTIELELTPQVKESEIVTSFVFRRGINSIVLSLNHVYNTKIIICPIDNLNWPKTSDNFMKQMAKKGIRHEDIQRFSDMLDNNYERILTYGDDFPHSNSDAQQEQEKKTVAQKALELAEGQCSEFFQDQFGNPYATVKIDEHTETLELKGSRFKNWLCKRFYEESGNAAVLNGEIITSILNILKARADFEGVRKDLDLRVASNTEEPHTIYYDLANKYCQAVKINADSSWSIEQAPIIFRRYPTTEYPQIYPERGYPEDIFDRFIELINVKDKDDKLLLKCYIVSLFYPAISKPVLMLHGEPKAAKTTAQELIRELVDPSPAKTFSLPKNRALLAQLMMHNYVCYFDNISDISDEISDALCRAVTGEAFQKRELYTDDEDILYSFIRCIGINGVNLGAQKPDLLSRGLIQRLENIDKTKRLKIKLIRKKFEEIKPQLLGYIFDTLVKVLQVQKKGGIELESYERFPDFEEIGEIMSRCMGNNENDFIKAYNKNVRLQSDEAIEAHQVGSAVMQLIEDLYDEKIDNTYEDNQNVNFKDKEFGGTMSALLTLLEPIAIKLKIDTKDKSWPKQPNTLSRRLNEVTASLREVGIIVERYVIDPHKKTKGIRIRKISSASSASTAIPIVGENDAQLASDKILRVMRVKRTIFCTTLMGPAFNRKNRSFGRDTTD